MSTLSQFGVPAAGFGLLQPKLKFSWQVTFVNLARLASTANSRDLTRQALTVDRPNLSFEEVAIHRYNSTAYVAGKHSWQTLALAIQDDITGLASLAIQGQLETQQRLIGGDLPGNWLNAGSTGSDYKFGLKMDMLDRNEGVVEQWLLEGCWIQTANYGNLDYSDGSGAAQIDLTIRFDHARQTLSGAGYGTALGGNL